MGVEFKGRVVLITGAGRGLGRELALEFAARGAMVAASDITPINVEAVVAEIAARGGQAKAYIADVAKKVAAQALVNEVLEDFGRLDILINHARVEPAFPLLELDEWDWHRALDVNLTGAFLMLQAAARVMRAQGGGTIVNLIALGERLEAAGHVAAAASLSGLIGLTHQAAAELRGENVRVYAIGQGFTFAVACKGGESAAQRVLDLCLADPSAGPIVYSNG